MLENSGGEASRGVVGIGIGSTQSRCPSSVDIMLLF